MPFSVVVDNGEVHDVVCRRLPAPSNNIVVVSLGDKTLGTIHKIRHYYWAVSLVDPSVNWAGEGLVNRYKAIEFLLRAANIYERR